MILKIHESLNLSDVSVGDTVTIKGFHGISVDVRKRLLIMGLIPKTELKIIRVAPLGDPIEIKLRGYSLTLRKDEAKSIIVEKKW